MSNVREYIMDMLQQEYSFKENADVDSINYVKEGYMDSLGLLKFIGEMENEFSIVFSDEELMSPSFQIVGELISMVEAKLSV